MFNPFTLISDLNTASQAGQEITNPKTWSNRASLVGRLTILMTIGLSLLKQFTDIDLGLSDDDIHQVTVGIAVIGVAIANRLHVASNPNAGKSK